MAKKPADEPAAEPAIQEGDQEPGETVPSDDSHIAAAAAAAAQEEAQQEPAPAADPEPELVDVEIGGQIFKLSPDAAEAYRVDLASSQLQQQQAPAYAPTPEGEGFNYSEALYSDPDAFVSRIRRDIIQELRGEYSEDQARRDFWTSFYGENSELKEYDTLVKATIEDNWSVLGNMSGKPARDKIANLTQTTILGIANKHSKGAQGKKGATTSLEGASASDAPVPSPDEQVERVNSSGRPFSIGDALKERRLARERAQRTLS